jgi:hypothetical protein
VIPQGFHQLSLTDIESACVAPFGLSRTRQNLMAALQLVVEQLNDKGISGVIWLDGSFVTKKD